MFAGSEIRTCILRTRGRNITCCRVRVEEGQNEERILEREDEGTPYLVQGRVGVSQVRGWW